MIRALVQLCVRRFGVVTALTLMALLIGARYTAQMPLDVFPDFVPSQVDIQTEAPGFSSSQVEQLITKPIEDAVAAANGVETLRSTSIPGLSVITITFKDGSDLRIARQGVAEQLSELGNTLPSGAGTPTLSPLVSSTMDLLKIGLVSDRVDAYTLRDTADWVIKPQLLAVPGVAHVIVFGGAVRQIQIKPDPAKLLSYGLTLTDVQAAAQNALALQGVGLIDLPTQRLLLQAPTPSPDLRTLGLAVITTHEGTPVTLRDIAQIDMAPAVKTGDALVMGRPGVMLSLASQYGANTLSTTHDLEKVLAQVIPTLTAQGITVYPALHRPATFIERALHSLQSTLMVAAVLILVLLFAFLRNLRAALIAFLAIPLSLFAAVATLGHFGLTLNTMTLGGFAVALGVLVDDAIIDIENILRRLHANAQLEQPRARLDIILESSLEVRRPVLFATAVVIAAFLPELFATNLQGHFVGPLALAFVLAVLASLLVAMTVTPALCALLLHARASGHSAGWLELLKRWQQSLIQWVDRAFWPVIIVIGLVTLLSAALMTRFPESFMPDFREGHFVMQVSSAPGTSLEEMIANGERISADVLRLPYVQTVEQQLGRAQSGEDTWGTHQSEFHVEFKPDATVDQSEAQKQLRDILARYPGIHSEVVTFLGDRISESLSGETAEVAVKVFGDDLDQLDAIAGKLSTILQKIPGVVDLGYAHQQTTPVLSIQLRPAALAATGLNAQQVLEAIDLAYGSSSVGQTYVGTRTINVVIRLPDSLRASPAALSRLTITGPLGPVPLSQVATLQLAQDRYQIEHDGSQRRISVTFNVSGHSVESVVAQAQQQIRSSLTLPAGVTLQFTGTAEAAQQARTQLLVYSVIALALILLGLFLAFHWPRHVWLTLWTLPFSLVGCVAVIGMTGIGLSVGSMVGLVTIFGISARNAILQLSHYEHLVEEEGEPWSAATVLRGAQERLTPILMTAVMTALGLAPLALGSHQPGQEIEGPMAITVLGGLLSSTLLNLTVLPVLARRFGGRREPIQSPVHS